MRLHRNISHYDIFNSNGGCVDSPRERKREKTGRDSQRKKEKKRDWEGKNRRKSRNLDRLFVWTSLNKFPVKNGPNAIALKSTQTILESRSRTNFQLLFFYWLLLQLFIGRVLCLVPHKTRNRSFRLDVHWFKIRPKITVKPLAPSAIPNKISTFDPIIGWCHIIVYAFFLTVCLCGLCTFSNKFWISISKLCHWKMQMIFDWSAFPGWYHRIHLPIQVCVPVHVCASIIGVVTTTAFVDPLIYINLSAESKADYGFEALNFNEF